MTDLFNALYQALLPFKKEIEDACGKVIDEEIVKINFNQIIKTISISETSKYAEKQIRHHIQSNVDSKIDSFIEKSIDKELINLPDTLMGTLRRFFEVDGRVKFIGELDDRLEKLEFFKEYNTQYGSSVNDLEERMDDLELKISGMEKERDFSEIESVNDIEERLTYLECKVSEMESN